MRILLLLGILLAGAATAHLEPTPETRSLQVGPYDVLLEWIPSPAYANQSIRFTAVVTSRASGDLAADVEVRLALGGDPAAEARLRPDRSGQHMGSVRVAEPGRRTVEIQVTDAAQTHRGTTEITVYPDFPWRLRALPDAQDPTSGQVATLRLETVDARLDQPVRVLQALRARIEAEPPRPGVAAVEVDLVDEGNGTWRLDHVFPEPGVYRVRLVSEADAIGEDDLPPMRVQVARGVRAVDAPPAPLLLAAVLVGAACRSTPRRS